MLGHMDAPTDVGPGPTPGATPLPPGPPAGRPGPRRLRRRPDDGHIAGVCAGVAEYFNVDPVIVRIAAVVLAFSGPGVFAYILAWIFVPEAHGPVPHGAPQAPIDRKDRGTQILGIVLLGLALSVIWGDWWSPARHLLFPIGLMALGAWLLLRRDKDDDPTPTPSPPPSAAPMPPPSAWAASAAPTDVTAPVDITTPIDTATDPTSGDDIAATVDDPTSTQVINGGDAAGGGPPTAPWNAPPPPVPPEPPASARRRRVLGPIVFGTLLVWSGLAWLTDVSLETGLAVGLLIIGVGFVLGSFVGGSRALILPALIVGGALAVTAVVDIPLSGPIGEQQWAPQRVADVEGLYDVSIGEGTLDLTAIELAPGDRLGLEATVGLGHLVVLVPEGLALEVTTEVGAGESQVLDLQQNGVGITTDQQEGDPDATGTLVLDLHVGMGQVEVRRFTPDDGSTTPTTATTLG